MTKAFSVYRPGHDSFRSAGLRRQPVLGASNMSGSKLSTWCSMLLIATKIPEAQEVKGRPRPPGGSTRTQSRSAPTPLPSSPTFPSHLAMSELSFKGLKTSLRARLVSVTAKEGLELGLQRIPFPVSTPLQ